MRINNLPGMDDPSIPEIEDVREDATKRPRPENGVNATEKGDIEVPDKTLTEDPKGDIGYEMQPLRGYGKSRLTKPWRVR